MLLYAGPLQMLYDRGFLRYIGYQDQEILRMMYYTVRDENWGTCDHEIIDEHRDISWETFRIEYDCTHSRNGEKLMKWHTVIEGRPNSSITFTINGEVLQDHAKNRSGFCILHPIEPVAGKDARLFHPDGKTSHAKFPEHVAGDNPFKNLSKLRWSAHGREFELTFEGDVFETEDQRNWTDASYKTFCTPSDLPIPVKMKRGTKVWQRVVFKPVEHLPPIATPSRIVIQLEKTQGTSKFPKIGVAASHDVRPLPANAVEKIKSLRLDHYRVNVIPSNPDWVADFSAACEEAANLELYLETALYLSEGFEEELEKFLVLCLQNRLRIRYLLLLSKDKPITDERIRSKIPSIKSQLKDVKIGAGTDLNFKDINRKQLPTDALDFISYPAQPQEHAFDDLTLIENTAGIFYTLRTAAAKYPGIAPHVSPITLRKRTNHTSSDEYTRKSSIAAQGDPRQSSDLNALFTFGVLKHLTAGHASAATLFQTAGNCGLMDSDGNSYPVFNVLREILFHRDAEIIELRSTHPLWVDAMLLRHGNQRTIWLANFTDDHQTAKLGRQEFQLQPGSVQHFGVNE